ncbi:acetolactate synthase [Mameliella alba]|nr:acetolactate synthase [Mameliella alba]
MTVLCGPLRAQEEAAPVLKDILPTSGLEFTYHDVIAEPPLWRVRYVVPALDTAELPFEEVAGDIELLCTQDALRRVTDAGGEPATIVITLMSEPVDFGIMTPDVTQFFESFFVQSDLCIWEAF